MWPVNEEHVENDDSATPQESRTIAADDPTTDVPADTDDRTPEVAGYGYGV
jgi:hypothetical protein